MNHPERDAGSPGARKALRVKGVLVIACVGVTALVLGGLTSPAQQYLPASVNSFANSASGWTMLTSLLIWLSRLRPAPAAVAGAVAFVLMVEGYRIVSEWRGYGYGLPFRDVFSVIGLLAGPVVGVSASFLRYGARALRALSIVPLSAVLIGEGAYGLTIVAATTSPVYWWIILTAGIAITVIHLIRQSPGLLLTLATGAATVIGAAAFWVGYQLI